MRKIIEFLLIFLASAQIHAAEPVQVPPQCQGAVGTVALIDCLRNQQEIISQLYEYYSITAQIRKLQAEQGTANDPPAAITPVDRDSDPEMSSAIVRANWFDQELEVYAVVGSPSTLTAYARLDGREYRLREGDSIRLARVLKVHSRGVELSVAGHEISVGLSGRTQSAAKENDE